MNSSKTDRYCTLCPTKTTKPTAAQLAEMAELDEDAVKTLLMILENPKLFKRFTNGHVVGTRRILHADRN